MTRSLLEIPLDELAELLGSRTRALRAFAWLADPAHGPPAAMPERVPGVAADSWASLAGRVDVPPWRVSARRLADDGTCKYAISLGSEADAARSVTVETVLIPARGRSTVCVSSQAGCTRRCAFCATASLGFTRNLTAGEIFLQYLLARRDAPAGAPARNVVFMGMGEPMDNLDAVLQAVDLLTREPAPRLAAAHVTVSTSGILPGIERFLGESRANLALSLNGTTDAQRESIMPHNRRWPIARLLAALRADAATAAARASSRRYFMEYVLLDGVNDADDDARRLCDLLAGLPAHVNLIPHNPFAGSLLRPPPRERVERFQSMVHHGGVRCLIRWPRGRDIDAACGQLALGTAAAAARRRSA